MAEQEPQPDDRPRPQYGELAPPGWVWRPPADADRLDTSRPLESLAEITALAAQRGLSNQFFAHERLAQQIKDYDVDGIVFHGIKSCRFVSSGMADTRDYLNKRLKIPSLYIESDLIDPRYWSDAQIKNRVDAFFESLNQRGGPAPHAGRAAAVPLASEASIGGEA